MSKFLLLIAKKVYAYTKRHITLPKLVVSHRRAIRKLLHSASSHYINPLITYAQCHKPEQLSKLLSTPLSDKFADEKSKPKEHRHSIPSLNDAFTMVSSQFPMMIINAINRLTKCLKDIKEWKKSIFEQLLYISKCLTLHEIEITILFQIIDDIFKYFNSHAQVRSNEQSKYAMIQTIFYYCLSILNTTRPGEFKHHLESIKERHIKYYEFSYKEWETSVPLCEILSKIKIIDINLQFSATIENKHKKKNHVTENLDDVVEEIVSKNQFLSPKAHLIFEKLLINDPMSQLIINKWICKEKYNTTEYAQMQEESIIFPTVNPLAVNSMATMIREESNPIFSIPSNISRVSDQNLSSIGYNSSGFDRFEKNYKNRLR